MTISNPEPPVLFVDLDGTLIKTDLLHESALQALKKNLWLLFIMPFWLMRGRAYLKSRIAAQVRLDTGLLPVQDELLEFLKEEHARGRKLVLATASDQSLALAVADRFGIFEQVLASTADCNLKGEEKLKAILAMTGGAEFDYAGNARADFPIWERASTAIVTIPNFGVLNNVRKMSENMGKTMVLFNDRPSYWTLWMKQARLYQWLKNLLIGVPLLTSHTFTMSGFHSAGLAFIAFGLVASATYVFNDLIDLNNDRQHPRKKMRPFAAGNLSIAHGIIGMTLLLTGGLLLASSISVEFLFSALVYLVLTLSYSLVFKSYVLLDVLLLASLYTIRIIAGALAIQVDISSWLVSFSMFTFLSLALIKRASELVMLNKEELNRARGRDYQFSDFNLIVTMGITAGYIAVLVLALFVDNSLIQLNYHHPRRLWLLCPLMLYWISRLWIKTTRGEMTDDPIIFSIRDRPSWLILAGMICVTIMSI